MATDTFRRHTRASVDVALHSLFASTWREPDRRAFIERLVRALRPRTLVEVSALPNFLPFEDQLVRTPELWRGAAGHPLAIIDSFASHLFGRYPTPRFLSSVWFGGRTADRVERREWFIAHARGQRFRSLPLPLAMTKKMEHVFLHTPDHVPFDHALRRAEVIGLGGTPELADAVVDTKLGERFDDPERWRNALAWLVRCGDDVDLAQVRPVVDFLTEHLRRIELRGRTFASVMRLVRGWHGWLGAQRARYVRWPRSRWNEMSSPAEVTEGRSASWHVVEITDSRELMHESRVMHHCVGMYLRDCTSRHSSIWSLRHRWSDEPLGRSVLTIEVRPRTRTIVQVRGKANALPTGAPLELVRQWAAREGLNSRY